MPNWCHNYINISSNNTESLKRFKDIIIENGVFSFCQTVPGPENLDWNINNWGTKWDVEVDVMDIEFDTNSISFQCDTAWAPPNAWAITAAEKYGVRIFIKYDEPGMEFCGTLIATPDGHHDKKGVYGSDFAYF